MQNTLKEKLTRGEKPIGTFVTTGSAAVVEERKDRFYNRTTAREEMPGLLFVLLHSAQRAAPLCAVIGRFLKSVWRCMSGGNRDQYRPMGGVT